MPQAAFTSYQKPINITPAVFTSLTQVSESPNNLNLILVPGCDLDAETQVSGAIWSALGYYKSSARADR